MNTKLSLLFGALVSSLALSGCSTMHSGTEKSVATSPSTSNIDRTQKLQRRL